MKLGESLVVSLRSLTVNRLRTFLTMLGIIIGVAAVIALVSAGQGAEDTIASEIDSLGSNLIIISPARGLYLELEDAEYVMSRVDSLAKVMPTIQITAEVAYEQESADISVQGVTEDFPDIRVFYPERGRFLIKSDVDSRRRVAVVGKTVVNEVFGGQDPVGQVLTVNGQPFTVVGVMEEKGESMVGDNDNVVLVPVTTLQRIAGRRYVSSLYAQVDDVEHTASAVSLVENAFDSKFRRSDTVSVVSQQQILDVVSIVTSTFTVLLSAIAGISLLVGGIGIMNIMLVSVTERTREIGLRKAVGAKKRDIMFQFLVEASILSGTGGLFGVGLGSVLTRLLARYGGWGAATSPSAILIAVAFSVAVGMFFGLYPASRAANLDPIYCLRFE